MFDIKNKRKYYQRGYVFLGIFLMLELIVRPVLQPDPWLLKASHWYFNQPLRLIIEICIVLMVLSVIKSYDQGVLIIKKDQLKLTFISCCVSILIFSFMELEQLRISFSNGVFLWITWFLTGLFIGIGQELIYRGLLYEYIQKKFSYIMTNIIITAMFVLMPLHSIRMVRYLMIGEYQVVLLLVAIYASASLFFTWLRKESKSVTIPAIVHGLGNAITWVAVFSAF